jgi:hypothetical protein
MIAEQLNIRGDGEAILLFARSIANIRFWPKADIPNCTAHVAFRGKADMPFCTAYIRL